MVWVTVGGVSFGSGIGGGIFFFLAAEILVWILKGKGWALVKLRLCCSLCSHSGETFLICYVKINELYITVLPLSTTLLSDGNSSYSLFPSPRRRPALASDARASLALPRWSAYQKRIAAKS